MPIFVLISSLALGGIGFFLYFHRIPKRIISSNPDEIVAPADGKVWKIVHLGKEEQVEVPKQYLGKIKTLCTDVQDAAYVVSIFMSPLDCHVNWSPVTGELLQCQHTSGKFSLANTWGSMWNEKNELLVQGSGFQLKVIQIAGFVARRIDCWVKKGDNLSKGQRIGMIRLGSQVTLILPRQVSLEVKTGQKVRGGETVIARIKARL